MTIDELPDFMEKKLDTITIENKTSIELAKQAIALRTELFIHMVNTIKSSKLDARADGALGLSLYAITLFLEMSGKCLFSNNTGRLILRSLTEIYITFSYLLKKESEENGIWAAYRSYGTGQLKLIYLKLEELKESC
jgi:hypothetical protein